MRLDSRAGVRGMVRNRDTGELIRWVRWAEIPEDPEQPGEFEAFRSNPEEWKARGLPLSEIIYRGRARLQFIPAAPRIGGRPTSARELYESLDDARKSLVNPKLLVPGEECEERFCHRLASWQVADEHEIEPHTDAEGRRHERAVTVRVHCYCDRHFRLPVMVSRRGVESEVNVEARPHD